MSETERSWRFERSVSLGVVVALALQTAGALMWAGAAGVRLDQLEARAEAASAGSERLARLEAEMAQARASLERIERRLDGRD